jgi:hypothetical protein
MQFASGIFPVEGTALSCISQNLGRSTGVSVLDDFLPWQGLPLSALTVLEGPQAAWLARKLVSNSGAGRKSIWIHSLRQRPFFQESESWFRLQVPQESDVLQALPEIVQDPAFTSVILQVPHPISRPKAFEVLKAVKASDVPVILVCKQPRSFPWELVELVIEANEDFLSVRKAQNRPVPLWIPVEMLENAKSSGSVDSPMLSWWNALEPVTG